MTNQIAYNVMLFFICFNCAVWIVDGLITAGFIGIPAWSQPYTKDFGFMSSVSTLLGNPIGWLTSMTGVATLTTGVMAGLMLLTGHNLLGFGFITIFALSFFATPILLIVNGLPLMASQFGVPEVITLPLTAFMGFIWGIFLLEFVGGRDVG